MAGLVSDLSVVEEKEHGRRPKIWHPRCAVCSMRVGRRMGWVRNLGAVENLCGFWYVQPKRAPSGRRLAYTREPPVRQPGKEDRMGDQPISHFTTFLAVWGAVTGTLATVIHGIVALRDRVSIGVNASQALIPPEDGEDDGRRIMLNITNRGRRPVTIAAGGLVKTGSGELFHFVSSMEPNGHRLEENESMTCPWRPSAQELPLPKFKYAWARDATGRRYRGRCLWNQ